MKCLIKSLLHFTWDLILFMCFHLLPPPYLEGKVRIRFSFVGSFYVCICVFFVCVLFSFFLSIYISISIYFCVKVCLVLWYICIYSCVLLLKMMMGFIYWLWIQCYFPAVLNYYKNVLARGRLFNDIPMLTT